MKEQFTVVTRKGQITVPVEIRRALNLQIGDKVAISLDEADASRASLRPVRSVVDATFGIFESATRPGSDEEMRQRFMESATERDQRTR